MAKVVLQSGLEQAQGRRPDQPGSRVPGCSALPARPGPACTPAGRPRDTGPGSGRAAERQARGRGGMARRARCQGARRTPLPGNRAGTRAAAAGLGSSGPGRASPAAGCDLGRLPHRGARQRRNWTSRPRSKIWRSWERPWCGCRPGRGLGSSATRRWCSRWGRFFRVGRPDLALAYGTLCGRSTGPRAPPSCPGRKPRGAPRRTRSRRRRKRKCEWRVDGRPGSRARTMAPASASPETAGSETRLDSLLQTLYDLGENGSRGGASALGARSPGSASHPRASACDASFCLRREALPTTRASAGS